MSTQIDSANGSFPGTVSCSALILTPPGGIITGQLQNVVTVTNNYAAQQTDDVIFMNAAGKTVTLPDATAIPGKQIRIKQVAAGACTVATTSSQNIDGATTYSLAAQYNSVTVESDGVQWYILAKV